MIEIEGGNYMVFAVLVDAKIFAITETEDMAYDSIKLLAGTELKETGKIQSTYRVEKVVYYPYLNN